MSVKFHWGYVVDSEAPITGVFSLNSLEFINEEAEKGIDLAWHRHLLECKSEDHDDCAQEDSDTFLIGFVEGDEGKFDVDTNAEWSAIVSYSWGVVQVIKSRHTVRAALCSPCFPGQADGDTEGEFLAYAPPPDVVGDIHTPGKNYKGGKKGGS